MEDINDQVDKIWATFRRGGPFSHNLVGMLLNTLSKSDKNLADITYDKLIKAGY